MKKLLFVLLFFPLIASAQIYKWTDENGKVHFSDKPHDNKSERVEVNTDKIGGTLVTPETKARVKYENSSQAKAERAQKKYDEIRSQFYETETPGSACRYAVDLQDRSGRRNPYAPKRIKYLCPKE